MADISTFVGRAVVGNECMTWGTYTDAGAGAGGDLNTKLHRCTKIFIQPYGSSVASNASVVNETLPTDGSAVAIVCDASQSGLWIAFGDMFN
ncbi:MAG: hypothetical protein WC455_19825 [Dehalococcoidia bacterium]|jgi:hypothetical protein